HPPRGAPRFGTGDVDRPEARAEWSRRLEHCPPEGRERELVRGFAWTGTVNAGAILGEAGRGGDSEALARAFSRWELLRGLPPASPVVLMRERLRQPYPLPLEGWDAEPAPTLLAAMERVAARAE